jgi:hypothetical protein
VTATRSRLHPLPSASPRVRFTQEVEVDGEVSGSVGRGGEATDDDELDLGVRQRREQALEIGHARSALTRDCRTASAKRSAAIILRIRSVVESLRFSRSSE